MLSLMHIVVKAQHYFVTSSCMLLDEKTVPEIWLNLGLNLTIFRGTGPRFLYVGFYPLYLCVCRLGVGM